MRVAFLYNESDEDPAGLAEDSDPERSPIVAAPRTPAMTSTPLACTFDLAAVRRQLERRGRRLPSTALNRSAAATRWPPRFRCCSTRCVCPTRAARRQPMLATSEQADGEDNACRAAGLPTPSGSRQEREQGARESGLPLLARHLPASDASS